jgi:serine protease Do
MYGSFYSDGRFSIEILPHRYFTVSLARYGVYDFIALGFTAVRERFLDSVFTLYVVTSAGKSDVGTAFLLDDRRIVTARHCIEGMREVSIPGWDAEPAPLEALWVLAKGREDIAVLQFASDPFPGRPGFQLTDAGVLDEVLTMGYPPIAGFESVQVAERARIAGYLHSSTGAVAAAERSYVGGACLLITARVKGGNSGGPVINEEGKVVAVVSGLPFDISNPKRLDTLGYAVATQAAAVRQLLTAVVAAPSEVERMRFQVTGAGFQTT